DVRSYQLRPPLRHEKRVRRTNGSLHESLSPESEELITQTTEVVERPVVWRFDQQNRFTAPDGALSAKQRLELVALNIELDEEGLHAELIQPDNPALHLLQGQPLLVVEIHPPAQPFR